ALLSAEGPEVVLFHEQRQTRAVLSAVAPSLMLYTQNGQRRAELVLWPNDEPHLRFYNQHDHITWEAPATQASGEPSQRKSVPWIASDTVREQACATWAS